MSKNKIQESRLSDDQLVGLAEIFIGIFNDKNTDWYINDSGYLSINGNILLSKRGREFMQEITQTKGDRLIVP